MVTARPDLINGLMALSYCKCLARNHDIKWDSVSCLNTCHVRCHVRPWWALHDLHERRFIWSSLHRFLQSFECVLTFCYMCDVQTVCAALLSELYPLMRSNYCCWYEAVLLFEDIFHFLLHDSLFIFCRASHNEMARRTRTRSLCLFYLWNQVSSSFLWMLRECVLIVPLHNSVLSFPAGLWPRWPTPALVHWCRASKQRRAAVLCFYMEPLLGSPQGVECFLITLCQIRFLNWIASLSFSPCECQYVCAVAPWISVSGNLAWLSSAQW